ncbi:MAG: hypothetical protein Fur0043_05050 [Anaerolineales bacterium]
MKHINPYIILGVLCILAGVLGLLQIFGFLENASEAFWGIVFFSGGLAFLVVFLGGQWWAVIPALTLAGIGILMFLPATYEDLGGALFLGMLGLSFWLVYLSDRQKWWAILPGGILFTLTATAVLTDALPEAWLGAVFFAGLALTFLLVALLAGMRWAYWTALALGIVSSLAFVPGWLPLLNYAWAAALIVAGVFIIWRAIRY